MAKYQIEWTEEQWFRTTIEADTKQEAIDKWSAGNYYIDGRIEPYGVEIQDGVDVELIDEED